jgi:hypothetical protein
LGALWEKRWACAAYFQMAQAGDMAPGVWDGRSAGTQHMIMLHAAAWQTVVVIRTDGHGIKKAPGTCPGASPEFASLATAHEL